MKTLQECKDEVAKKYDCDNWEMLHLNLRQPDIRKTASQVFDEAAELYAQQFKDEVKDYNTSYGALAVKYKKLEEEKAKLIEENKNLINCISEIRQRT